MAQARMIGSLLLAGVLLTLAITQFVFAWNPSNLGDFGSFWETGRAFGLGEDPYAPYPLVNRPTINGHTYFSPNLNAPASLLLFAPLSLFSPLTAFHVWFVASVLTLVMLLIMLGRLFPVVRAPLPLSALVALPLVWNTLSLGQIELPLALCALGAWDSLRGDHPIRAGILLGIVAAVKPNLAVWPSTLLCAGFVVPALAAGVVIITMNLIPALFVGPGIYISWINAAAAYQPPPMLIGSFYIFGPRAGSVLGVALVAVLALWAVHSRPTALLLSERALIVSLLASPVAWNYYLLFLLAPFLNRRFGPLHWFAGLLAFLDVLSFLVLVTLAIESVLVPAPQGYYRRDIRPRRDAVRGREVYERPRSFGCGLFGSTNRTCDPNPGQQAHRDVRE